MSGRRGMSQTGGNTEPMKFVRKFGAHASGEEDNDNGLSILSSVKVESMEGIYGESEFEQKGRSKIRPKHNHSRSPEKKKHKKRSRSRDRIKRSPSETCEHKKRSRHDESPLPKSSPIIETDNNFNNKDVAKNPLNAAAEAAARAAAIIRMKQLEKEKKFQNSDIKMLLAKQETSDSSFDLVKVEADMESTEKRERKRKTRWSTTKAFVPGMPTILPSDLDDMQRQCYLLHMEIEEATRKIRQGDYLPLNDNDRSPSPEPIYDANGKRLNTREMRKRQELEQKRHEKIQALLKLNPTYKPPADYRAPNIRLSDKVWIPQDDHPEINFVGLLIGPRGNTLKALEQETGAKIIIRGKGSIKEGKMGRRDGPMPGENEPLHAYITGTDPAVIKRGVDKIKEIIGAALMIPDGQNELRRLQLRELAVLNGTLRPEDLLGGTRCSNCGSDQHKTWECPDAPNVTASIVCTACGGAGHIARDCKNPRAGYQFDGVGMDDEYSALMAELGEKPNGSASAMKQQPFRLPNPLHATNMMSMSGPPRPLRAPDPSYWSGEMAPPPPSMYPASTPASAYGAAEQWHMPQWHYQQQQPMPVPPPMHGSLSMFPPPPPPPPPPPGGKSETQSSTNNGGSSLSSFLAPPPPPQ